MVQIKTSLGLEYKPTVAFIRSIPTLLRVAGGLPKIVLRNWSLKRVEIPVVGNFCRSVNAERIDWHSINNEEVS